MDDVLDPPTDNAPTDLTPMTPPPTTPRSLAAARGRRTTDGGHSWKVKIATIVMGGLVTIATGFGGGILAVGDRDRDQRDRIAKVEARQEEQYKAILGRLDELKNLQEQYRQDARADINGIRDELLRILRSR